MPDSLRPHGLQPTRLLCPWDFPGKGTEVGSHFLLPLCLEGQSDLTLGYCVPGPFMKSPVALSTSPGPLK